MKNLKNTVINNIENVLLISTATLTSLLFLIIRIKLNKSFFYLFLVWNLILAFIPYIITMYLKSGQLKIIKFYALCGIWLLFLPNSPYIITDLLHLKVSNSSMLWLDIIVILSFALTGLYLFYTSLKDMLIVLESHFNLKYKNTLSIILIFLCGFGVYLGRYYRYNSWEIISKPQHLFLDILDTIIHPLKNKDIWLFTFCFGLFLIVGYKIFKSTTLYKTE